MTGDSGTGNAFELAERTTILDRPLVVLSLIYWTFILVYAYTLGIARPLYTVLFIGASGMIFIVNEASKSLVAGNRSDLLLLSTLGGITAVVTAYVGVYFWELFYTRPGVHYTHEYVLAAVFVATIVYLSYRAFGVAFVIVIGIALLYAAFGNYIPGLFGHTGLTGPRLLDVLVLEITGFYGSISRIIAAWVALFLLYTGLARAYGAFDLILRLAARAATVSRSGVAQFSVIASMAVGSINGSPSANTAMTGSFTIPMMKESGLPGKTAGGVEATASSGGQVMPPVMGAAAFVMASLLGITYFDVVLAGLIPATIFIAAVMIGVHYAAIRNVPEGLSPNIDQEFEVGRSRQELLIDISKFVIPFVVLVYTLGIAQWTIISAAMVTVLTQVATGVTFPLLLSTTRSDETVRESVSEIGSQTVDGFLYGAVILAPIAIIIAVINGIVDLITATGLPNTLTLALLDLSGGTLLIAAVVSMIICILLGLGMPSIAAYTIVAILVAPTFIEAFLIPDLAAHYFVFYSAVLSFITPPIANAVVISSGIAGSDFWETCLEAVRISAVLFVLPVVFLYNPELLVDNTNSGTLLLSGVILFGAVSIIHGLNYVHRFGDSRITDGALRVAFVGLGLVIMIYPDLLLSTGALTVAGGLAVIQRMSTEKTPLRVLLRERTL